MPLRASEGTLWARVNQPSAPGFHSRAHMSFLQMDFDNYLQPSGSRQMYVTCRQISRRFSSGHTYRSFPNLLAMQHTYSETVSLCATFAFFTIFRLASTIYHHFVAADSASESFASLKRIHGLMPYFMLKGILKISNPIGMIRGENARLFRFGT